MKLWVGKRVKTDHGPGRVVAIRNAKDEVRGGQVTRGVAYVTIELERGGRRIYQARKVGDLPP